MNNILTNTLIQIPEYMLWVVVFALIIISVFAATMAVFEVILVAKGKKLVKRLQDQGLVVQDVKKQEVSATVAMEIEPNRENAVTFAADKTQTIDDKYNALPKKDKKYYDEIVNYANQVEGVKRFKNSRYEEYKVGKSRLVRMLIKRDVITCEFILPNNDFKYYVNENKINVKQAATVLKIVDDASVKVAKDSIDIAVKAIQEEKELKKEQAKERRRLARQAKK